jgi:L-ascorbate metabolism protein UlaG (beta-lactamase superfamily)
MKLLLLCCLSLLCILKPVNTNAQEEQCLIKFIANEGFLVNCNSRKILIDALHHTNYKNGINSTPLHLVDSIINGKGIFSDTDLFLVSHSHQDHFSSELTYKFLNKNEGTSMISNNRTYTELGGKYPDCHNFLTNRLLDLNPNPGEYTDTILNEIRLSCFSVNHLPEEGKYMTLAFHITVGEWKILHLGDLFPDTNTDIFRKLKINNRGVDILMVDHMFLLSDKGQYILNNFIQPKEIIAMHISPDEIVKRKSELQEAFPGIIIFAKQGETKLFNK